MSDGRAGVRRGRGGRSRGRAVAPAIAVEALHRTWVHAHGEDSAAGRVFRPAGYPLPPSRGRGSFEFRPDGSFVEMTIGPTDRLEPAQGTWALDGDRLALCDAGAPSSAARTYRIVDLAADRLVLAGPLAPGA